VREHVHIGILFAKKLRSYRLPDTTGRCRVATDSNAHRVFGRRARATSGCTGGTLFASHVKPKVNFVVLGANAIRRAQANIKTVIAHVIVELVLSEGDICLARDMVSLGLDDSILEVNAPGDT
jgi:hypothetical protein